MDRNNSVSFRNKSSLPDDLLKIILDYEPTSNLILSQEEKVRYEPAISELSNVTEQLVLSRDVKALEELFDQSQRNKTYITSFLSFPQHFFDEANNKDELKEALYYMAKNSDKLRNLSSLDHFKKYLKVVENTPDTPFSDGRRERFKEFLQEVNESFYSDFIKSELNL